jgi:hypothetical protein
MYLLLVESITLVFTLPGVRSQGGTTLGASKIPNYPNKAQNSALQAKTGWFSMPNWRI